MLSVVFVIRHGVLPVLKITISSVKKFFLYYPYGSPPFVNKYYYSIEMPTIVL